MDTNTEDDTSYLATLFATLISLSSPDSILQFSASLSLPVVYLVDTGAADLTLALHSEFFYMPTVLLGGGAASCQPENQYFLALVNRSFLFGET